ncbi:MAG: hypothetical protein ACLP3C_08405 [Mycobacterium sp.]|uniref:hypothetical protein n=1 Tax=Mycobacterium sp. TaxID=1785 RepID=UPI003F9909F1
MSIIQLFTIAERLILANLNDDDEEAISKHAEDTIAAEVGDCPHCWRIIAEYLASAAATYLSGHLGLDEAISHVEQNVADALDGQAES